MSTLTGTKISQTYVGLLKTLDTTPLSDLPKEISDGLGNGSGVKLDNAGNLDVTNTVAFGSLKDTTEDITVTKFVDEADGIENNDDDTSIPTSAAVKDYVDDYITAQDLDFSGNNGTGDVDLDSEVFTITGSNGITTTALDNTLDIDGTILETGIATNATGIATNVTNIATNATNIASNDTDIANNTASIATNATDIASNDTDINNLQNSVSTNTSNISSNTADIATNVTNIATNATNISTNATNIASNDTDISTNAANIATNETAIESNRTDISTNATNISTNATNIASNASHIATNATDITTNSDDIGDLQTDVGTNTASIATNVTNIAANTATGSTNAGNIATNTTAIATNTTAISTNVTNIAANTTDIGTNTTAIGANTTAIATNTTAIGDNTTAISTNTTDIGTNATAISTNTTDIGTNATAISTNTTGIATNATNIANKVSKSGDTMTGDLSTSQSVTATLGFKINNDQSIFNYSNSLQIYSGAGTAIELGGGIAGRQNNVNVGNGYIYTSQGLRVGGVGTANELDDYEEGTYNIAFTLFKYNTAYTKYQNTFTTSANYSKYVKVGRKVTLFISFHYTNPTGTEWNDSTLDVGLANLPFSPTGGTAALFGLGGTWSFDSRYQTNTDTNNAFVCMNGGYNNYGNYIALGGGIKSGYPHNMQYAIKATEVPDYAIYLDTNTKVKFQGAVTYYTDY